MPEADAALSHRRHRQLILNLTEGLAYLQGWLLRLLFYPHAQLSWYHTTPHG
jgi:hypothetical protein